MIQWSKNVEIIEVILNLNVTKSH